MQIDQRKACPRLGNRKKNFFWEKRKDKQFKICCNGLKLERVSVWKQLDITIDENLTLSRLVWKIVKKHFIRI